jgi:hypothetical protein
VIAEAEIIIGGEVDDLAAVVMAERALRVVEDTKLEVGSASAQGVELGGEVGQLRALRRGLFQKGCRDTHDASILNLSSALGSMLRGIGHPNVHARSWQLALLRKPCAGMEGDL